MGGETVEHKQVEHDRPCLIGRRNALTDTEPTRFHPVRVDGIGGVSGCAGVASVDMVRLRLTFFSDDGGVWLSENLPKLDCDTLTSRVCKRAEVGKYFDFMAFGFGKTSVAVGLAHIGQDCKPNFRCGFLEFNPNKVASDPRFWRLLAMVGSRVKHVDVARFDLALDVPIERNLCRLTRDRRRYTSIVSDGLTEYLGVRNSGGFCKVYSKDVESGLSDALTRIELTCDGSWTAEDIVSHWPQVHGWQVGENTRGWVRVLGHALARLSELGEPVEPLVAMLGRGSRPKVREHLRTPLITLPVDAAEAMQCEAHSWCKRLLSGGDGSDVM